MWLDVALGVMILFGAIRGWFRGFVIQAIRLGGVVACVYAAAPLRDLSRPYVAPYLVSIRPGLLDRLLWWSAAAIAYVLVVGTATAFVKLYRKKTYGESEPNRGDQLAGFFLAGVRSAIVAAFLVSSLSKNALVWAAHVPWADEQAKSSVALGWNAQYHPADQIWQAPPVQQFVAHVRKMGIEEPEGDRSRPAVESAQTAQVATLPPRLDLPAPGELNPQATDFAHQFDKAFEALNRGNPRP
jgi:hypothetical protein